MEKRNLNDSGEMQPWPAGPILISGNKTTSVGFVKDHAVGCVSF